MKKIKTNIKGLIILKGKTFYDARGFLRETFKKKIIKKNLIFTIISKSNKNVLRGLHLQLKNPQGKYITVLQGKIFDVVIDLRPGSKTYLQKFEIELDSKDNKSLFIPEGFAHGFQTLDDNTDIYYQISQFFKPEYSRGILWNDPLFNINWPDSNPILSKKDKTYPYFHSD